MLLLNPSQAYTRCRMHAQIVGLIWLALGILNIIVMTLWMIIKLQN